MNDITTAAELNALPLGSVVRDREGDTWHRMGREWESPETASFPAEHIARKWSPLTVLFRPDAPQPTPVPTGAVERAARALAPGVWSDDYRPFVRFGETRDSAALIEADRESVRRKARAALDAARALEAVDREALRIAVGGVLFNATNYPERVQTRILGQDTRPLTEKVVDAVLAALAAQGDAAPTEPADASA